ncbi:MAG: hypothetical protein K9N06_08660 [Candidatus Cloacimonetes bacterium]|nr:hypothetical protein [Candidatus Cloacimonadota bacterium]
MRTALVLFCLLLFYLIIYGGQYSLFSLSQSTAANKHARQRNINQKQINDAVAMENYLIQTDKKTQKELSNELGYKERGEKIYKRTN